MKYIEKLQWLFCVLLNCLCMLASGCGSEDTENKTRWVYSTKDTLGVGMSFKLNRTLGELGKCIKVIDIVVFIELAAATAPVREGENYKVLQKKEAFSP
jgi:hypothetical protein